MLSGNPFKNVSLIFQKGPIGKGKTCSSLEQMSYLIRFWYIGKQTGSDRSFLPPKNGRKYNQFFLSNMFL